MKFKIKTDETSFWNNYAKIYPELEQATPYKKMTSMISSYINPKEGHVWLDAGCGPGSTIDIILNNGNVREVIGLDVNQIMLNHAKNKISKHPHGHKVNLASHDLKERIGYPDNYFDGIVSNLVLPYVSEHQKNKEKPLRIILEEMYRLLKPGGHLIWTTPVNKVNFFWVFLASWKEILNPRKPRNIIYGPSILRYALKIQKKGKTGEYTFWPKNIIKSEMLEIGFSDIEILDTFAKQAHVIRGIKKK